MKEKFIQLVRNLNFTGREKKVIVFIVFVVAAGSCIKIVNSKINPEKSFDFKRTDSVFKVLSSRNDFAVLDTIQSDSSAAVRQQKFLAASDSMNTKGRTGSKGSKQDFLKDTKININTAGKSDLIKLPGVGESTADKIIAYRSQKPFRNIRDIMNVKGIGEKKFDKMKDYIKTEN
ncbi:hypothetical protein BH10BAC5_BH10BAC5_05810 [soil metagenome]